MGQYLIVSDFRIQACNEAQINRAGDYVLYWMTANRRTHWNFSLQRAVEWSKELDKPIVILEAIRSGYQWASDRLHSFVIDGMRDNASSLEGSGVLYYPYLEPEPSAGKGLLAELGRRACVIVTDDFPCFFLPRMTETAALRLNVLMEKVDSNGLIPVRWTDRVFRTAVSFRRFIQNNIGLHLHSFPAADSLAGSVRPFTGTLPQSILYRWPTSREAITSPNEGALGSFPIDHSVPRSPILGGETAARRTLGKFLERGLARYSDCRNHPDDDASSGLSPYFHFGHISVHEVFHEVMRNEGRTMADIPQGGKGRREGWWGISPSAEAFLDELITWREIGFNMCAHAPDYNRYQSLPGWALETLDRHAGDPRPYVYGLDRLESADTHDPLWNAAQTQLRREGRLHNYLRMLWGKKILEWTRSPEEALEIMIHLNNKYALDGRDPNSYTGIFWTLGRYDRPWGPERPIFGKIRYMSSESTRKKLRVKDYLRKYA